MIVELKPDILRNQFVEYSELVLEGGYFIPTKNKQTVDDIFTTFENGKYGVIIYGQPGSGKTLIFDILSRIIPPKHKLHFRIINALNVVLDFNENGHECFRKYLEGDILFDDLGTEDKGVYYADKVEVFEKIIQFRYDAFKAKGVRTFFTSNLLESEIKTKYGQRCFSRMVEMCDRYILTDEDRRKLRNFKGFVVVKHNFESVEDIEWRKHYAEYTQKAKSNPVVAKRETLGDKFRKQLGVPDEVKKEIQNEIASNKTEQPS